MPAKKFREDDITNDAVKKTRACPRCHKKRTTTNWVFWRMGWRFVRGQWFCWHCRTEMAAQNPTENWEAV